MTPEQWRQVVALVEQLSGEPGESLEGALGRACPDDAEVRAEARRLLERLDTADPHRGGATSDSAAATAPEGGGAAGPSSIGPYRLLSVLGEGGFGVVWLAEQTAPVRRRVALKVIKPGMDSRAVVARFEAERQALALMDHPNVARVFDAGTTDEGRPYFAMELVRGQPATAYCDARRLGLEARLGLFITVCEAVQHAHTKGVIHRDIKPSNILVEDVDGHAVPKVIDFGVAKALNQRLSESTVFTEQGQMIGTPEYMSPEQATGSALETDTRSDVYSLGVLLYELLTGSRPFDLRRAALYEVQRVIREQEPVRPSSRVQSLSGGAGAERGDDGAGPSTIREIARDRSMDARSLTRRIRGDLDWIVLRCLEKERARRYETASALAADVRRYLADEPVSASPPSAAYRARKFVRRHRAGVAAGGLAAAALVLAAAVSVMFALSEAEQRRLAQENERRAIEAAERAEREAERALAAEAEAEQRAEELELVAEFQASQLADIETEVMGLRLRRGIVEKRRAFMEGRGVDEPDVEAALRELEQSLTGVNFTNVALETLDENIFERASKAIDEQFEDQPLIRARLLQTIANTLRTVGLLDRATAPQTEALDIRRRVLGDEHPDTLISIGNMGMLLRAQGQLAEAMPYYREVLETRRRTLGDEHPDTLTSINNMGVLLNSMGRSDEAMPYYREALETRRRTLGDEHPATLNSINSMGALLRAQGRLAEGEGYLREALEAFRRTLGDEHPATLNSINSMGVLLERMGRTGEAEGYYREALEGRRRVLGDEHPSTLNSISNMGVLLNSMGRYAEAMPYYREALEASRRVLGDEHPETLQSINNMGVLLGIMGRYDEAEPYLREALEGFRRVLGDEHPSTLNSINNMGALLDSLGRYDEAEVYFREALEARRRTLGDEHPATLSTINSMGVLLRQQGRLGEAEGYLREALEGHRRVLGDEHPSTLLSISNMGFLLNSMGRSDEAEPYTREALEARRRVLGDEHPNTLISISSMGVLLRDLGQLEEAERLGAEAVETARRALPPSHWHTAVFLVQHASTLVEMDRFAEAEERFLEAHAIFEAALGSDHERTTGNIEHLADLYDRWHAAEPGAGHDARAAEWRARLAEVAGGDDEGSAGEEHEDGGE